MKKYSLKKMFRWLREEFTLPVLLFLLLFAASGVWLFWIIFNYCRPVLLLLAVFLIRWAIERIVNYLKNHFSKVPKCCRECSGCNSHYPFIRQYAFQTFRKCAAPLQIVSPETEAMIETRPRPASDHIARAYFAVTKVPETSNVLDHSAICNLLTQNLNDFARETNYVDRLFADVIFEDAFSYTIGVALLCKEEDRTYLKDRLSPVRQSESQHEREEVYDDIF